MHTITARRIAFIATACITLVTQAAQAADTSTACPALHPALARPATCAATAGIDAHTFIVMPPAAVPHVRANHDHPAVAVARMQRTAQVDASTFIVQPPVTVTWTVMPQASMLAAGPVPAGAR